MGFALARPQQSARAKPARLLVRHSPGSRTLQNHFHTGSGFDQSNSRGIDEDSVAFAFVDDFRIACHQLHICLRGGILHRCDDGAQRFHFQPFFKNKSGTQIKGPRAAHGKVIYCAVNREITDVASRENQRTNDERICREG